MVNHRPQLIVPMAIYKIKNSTKSITATETKKESLKINICIAKDVTWPSASYRVLIE